MELKHTKQDEKQKDTQIQVAQNNAQLKVIHIIIRVHV